MHYEITNAAGETQSPPTAGIETELQAWMRFLGLQGETFCAATLLKAVSEYKRAGYNVIQTQEDYVEVVA